MYKLLQNIATRTREITGYEVGVTDDTGIIMACSDEKTVGMENPLIPGVLEVAGQTVILEGTVFQKIHTRNRLEFVVYIVSTDSDALKYLPLVSMNVMNIKAYYDEKFDRLNFIKSILTGDATLPGDTLQKAKELHIQYDALRTAFLIKIEKTSDIYAYEIIQGLFPNKLKDFIILLDDELIVLIKELKTGEYHREIEKTANIIIDTLSTELMVKATIGIGTVAGSIKDIGRSYNEAKLAMLVGDIFDSDRSIVNYNNLGIGRLIYQIPSAYCRLFLREVFKNDSFESLDPETMITIQKFFDNSLNVSETSRQLYIHRNTLVYRLDKIQKITGLDIRKFDDAIVFKIAILVKKYMDSIKINAD